MHIDKYLPKYCDSTEPLNLKTSEPYPAIKIHRASMTSSAAILIFSCLLSFFISKILLPLSKTKKEKYLLLRIEYFSSKLTLLLIPPPA